MLGAVMYWQLLPLILVSAGAGLDLKKLAVYPIRTPVLFAMDLGLRATQGVEVLLVLTGIVAGLWRNPTLPSWVGLAALPFAVFNAGMATALREWFGRILPRRGVGEAAMFFLVMVAALPQLLLASGWLERASGAAVEVPMLLPWMALSAALMAKGGVGPWLILMTWAAIGVGAGYWQFARGLRHGIETGGGQAEKRGAAWLDAIYRLPGCFASDPVAAIVERELRTLVRAPRFRLAFVMGFTFGFLVWLPLGANGATTAVKEHYLAFLMAYGMLLLGELVVWNSLGFDRAGIQIYYALFGGLRPVLRAKNIAAVCCAVAQMAFIVAVSAVLGLPLAAASVAEAVAANLLFLGILLTVGNLSSVHAPRPVSPDQLWRRSSASRTQALALILFPVLAAPVLVAYAARYWLNTPVAFWTTLGFSAILAVLAYQQSFAVAERVSRSRKEQILMALSEGEGPLVF
jgi:ABC-2 type transport system permease protein